MKIIVNLVAIHLNECRNFPNPLHNWRQTCTFCKLSPCVIISSGTCINKTTRLQEFHQVKNSRLASIMESVWDNKTNGTMTELPNGYSWITSIAFPILGLVIICASLPFLVLIIYIKESLKTNIFIFLNWTVSEILSAFAVLVQTGFRNETREINTTMAVLEIFPIWSSCSLAIFCIADAYMSVMMESHYDRLMSKKRIALYLCLIWIYSITWSCIPFAWNTDITGIYYGHLVTLHRFYLLLLSILHFIPGLILLGYCSWRMSRYLRDYETNMHVTHTLAQEQLVNEAKAAGLVLHIVAAYFLVWIPFIVACLIGDVNDKSWVVLLLLSYVIGNLGSVAKIVVLVVFSQQAREAAKGIITFKKRVQPF